jgi:beta-lactam-binding protein with PASTA domain
MRDIVLWLSVVLVSAITALTTTVVVLRSQRPSPQEDRVVVPNLVSISEKDARENLRALGFVFLVGPRKPSTDAETGTVIAQSIRAGQPARRGAAVTVTLALALPKVPNVVGRSLDEAKQLLGQQDLKLEEGKPVPSNDVPLGRIVSQDPAAGVTHDKARPVVVQVSSGPTESVVPKLLGQPVSKAKETLKEVGLELGNITWTEEGETPTGVVLNQHPPPDTKAKPGDKVRITVNR